jgi:hypothetical protein
VASEARSTPAQISYPLRKAEVELANGKTVREVCMGLGVSEPTDYRSRGK